MKTIRSTILGIATITISLSAHAQPGCPLRGNELVVLGAGGTVPGVPAKASGPAQAAADATPSGLYTACLNVKTGHLTLLGLQAKVLRASWVLIDPRKLVVYTTGGTSSNTADSGSIFSFKIDRPKGTLQPLGSSPSGGSDPTHLAWDPHTNSLFIANHGEGTVGVIKTDADGGSRALTYRAQQEGSGPSPRQKHAAAHGVAVDPTGRFVLSTDFGADKMYVYHYDAAAGKLSPADPAFLTEPAGSGPRHITFSPDGKYVVMNSEMDGRVRVFHWDGKAGTLAPTQTVDPFPSNYTGVKSAAEIQFSRNGKFFYLSLRGSEDKLLVYKWDGSAGQLTEVQRIPSAGGTPWAFSIDPLGKWLLVANSTTGNVSVFAVEKASGKLTPTADPLKLSGVLTLDFLAK